VKDWFERVDTKMVGLGIILLAFWFILARVLSYEVYAAWSRWTIAGLAYILYQENKKRGP
jgi:heme A synthase